MEPVFVTIHMQYPSVFYPINPSKIFDALASPINSTYGKVTHFAFKGEEPYRWSLTLNTYSIHLPEINRFAREHPHHYVEAIPEGK
ncbi:hypothetical protein CEXT_242621 [Caerostris extrusa]|uniref:Uncharacterized protein n=1 Tax=Caerostris extrusa TaxID=172846 RepID=A0AAV4N8K8_CAEEX|nr:hypothetical protein CEXT_242621 [Caerostris extrusa]